MQIIYTFKDNTMRTQIPQRLKKKRFILNTSHIRYNITKQEKSLPKHTHTRLKH